MQANAWRNKKFGRLTGEELHRLLELFDGLWKDREAFASLRDDPALWVDALNKLATLPNWIPFYEISLLQLVANLVMQTGVGDEFVAAAKGGVKSLLDFVDGLPDRPPPTSKDALPAAMAMIGNLEAISIYSRTVNDMVEAAKSGDVAAIAEALSVDAYLICRPFFLAGMRIDQLSGDKSFTREVMRTICGPHKRRHEYVKLRWAEYLLRDQGAFQSCSREDIYALLVEDLRLYDPAGEKRDPKSALFALFRKWQKQAGIQNPRFGFSVKRKS